MKLMLYISMLLITLTTGCKGYPVIFIAQENILYRRNNCVEGVFPYKMKYQANRYSTERLKILFQTTNNKNLKIYYFDLLLLKMNNENFFKYMLHRIYNNSIVNNNIIDIAECEIVHSYKVCHYMHYRYNERAINNGYYGFANKLDSIYLEKNQFDINIYMLCLYKYNYDSSTYYYEHLSLYQKYMENEE